MPRILGRNFRRAAPKTVLCSNLEMSASRVLRVYRVGVAHLIRKSPVTMDAVDNVYHMIVAIDPGN